MPKKKSSKSYYLYALHVPVLLFALIITFGGIQVAKKLVSTLESGTVLAKKSSNDKSNNSNKEDKSNPSTEKSNNSNNVKCF